jgi:hypothetical protein
MVQEVRVRVNEARANRVSVLLAQNVS